MFSSIYLYILSIFVFVVFTKFSGVWLLLRTFSMIDLFFLFPFFFLLQGKFSLSIHFSHLIFVIFWVMVSVHSFSVIHLRFRLIHINDLFGSFSIVLRYVLFFRIYDDLWSSCISVFYVWSTRHTALKSKVICTGNNGRKWWWWWWWWWIMVSQHTHPSSGLFKLDFTFAFFIFINLFIVIFYACYFASFISYLLLIFILYSLKKNPKL